MFEYIFLEKCMYLFYYFSKIIIFCIINIFDNIIIYSKDRYILHVLYKNKYTIDGYIYLNKSFIKFFLKK